MNEMQQEEKKAKMVGPFEAQHGIRQALLTDNVLRAWYQHARRTPEHAGWPMVPKTKRDVRALWKDAHTTHLACDWAEGSHGRAEHTGARRVTVEEAVELAMHAGLLAGAAVSAGSRLLAVESRQTRVVAEHVVLVRPPGGATRAVLRFQGASMVEVAYRAVDVTVRMKPSAFPVWG